MDDQCKGCRWEISNDRKIDESLETHEWAEITGILPRSIRRHRAKHGERKTGSAPRVAPAGNNGTAGFQYRWEVGPEAFDDMISDWEQG